MKWLLCSLGLHSRTYLDVVPNDDVFIPVNVCVDCGNREVW